MARHRVAALSDVPEQRGLEVVCEGHVLGIYRVGGDVFAMDGVCPHSGGPLSTGYLSGTTAVCPWHGWQFDVTCGQHRTSPTVRQRTFAVDVVDDDVFVTVEEDASNG